MKKNFCFLLWLIFSFVIGCSSSSSTSFANQNLQLYYQQALDKKAEELKEALHTIIKNNHKPLLYKAVWEALVQLDADPQNPNNVILIYTRRSQPASTQDRGQNNTNHWNREHLWAKSHGFPAQQQPAYTDLHHLRAADRSVNSDRRELDFDWGGQSHTEATEVLWDRDSWEPPTSVKGDIARALFYMAVRYQGGMFAREGEQTLKEPDLELTDQIPTGYEPQIGKLSTLLEWNKLDPPDSREIWRNEEVYKLQGNRNPFIDHNAWVESIWPAEHP